MFVCCRLVVTTSIDSAGSDLGQVHDAFFIGIEDEAKERLERLAASKRITPVDITKLAHQVRFDSILYSIYSKESVGNNNNIIDCSYFFNLCFLKYHIDLTQT